MARRAHYQSELECPGCRSVCMATWEENGNKVYARAGFRRGLVSLSSGFRKAQGANTIICERCDVAISSWV